jgi:hypothetical protein
MLLVIILSFVIIINSNEEEVNQITCGTGPGLSEICPDPVNFVCCHTSLIFPQYGVCVRRGLCPIS